MVRWWNESSAAIHELAIGPNFWHFRNRQSKKLQFPTNRSTRKAETTWSARTWLTFAMQRVSVAVHKAVAKELSDALGFSGAVDPRGVPRD